MQWQLVSGNWVLLPRHPRGIIHFLGGAFVATAPQTTYTRLLEFLATQGFAVIATPFVNTLDHAAIAREVQQKFTAGLTELHNSARLKRYLPTYGLGHSMGCKLHLLIGSYFKVERSGNILISFNNFSARKAIPFMDSLAAVTTVEFTPTPAETLRLVQDQYQTRRNLLVQFSKDDIDQTPQLAEVLQRKFPNLVTWKKLTGTHLTPLGQDLKWQMGQEFSPLDAVGQWVRQEVFRELQQLEQTIDFWLVPMA